MANNNIIGIFNYCDYWCERCAFTNRCGTYQMKLEDERLFSPRDHNRKTPRDDKENAAFWNSVDGILARARKELDAITTTRNEEDFFYGWEEPTEEEMREFMEREEENDRKIRAHPLSQLAERYFLEVGKWLESAKPDIAAATADMVACARCEIDVTAGTARGAFDELAEMFFIKTSSRLR